MTPRRPRTDFLGAHVSTEGGVALAPGRGAAIGAGALQVFTKTPNQWREPRLEASAPAQFKAELAAAGIPAGAVVAHDSYLINLASPDARLRARSVQSFIAELVRCRALGIPWVVSHPGNYMDERAAGLERNACGYAECLVAVPGEVGVLIEGTAGAGTALGSTFEELRALRDALPAAARTRIAFCLDTAHLHAAGYDVAGDVEGVWGRFERELGPSLLKCLHLNDSKAAAGSRLDRHEWIGEGRIGPAAFRRIMRDPRFARVIKIIETPKGDDPVEHDRRMLRRLRAYARGDARAPPAAAHSSPAPSPSTSLPRAPPTTSPHPRAHLPLHTPEAGVRRTPVIDHAPASATRRRAALGAQSTGGSTDERSSILRPGRARAARGARGGGRAAADGAPGGLARPGDPGAQGPARQRARRARPGEARRG